MNDLNEPLAEEYARWFHCLAEPTRLRILHTVAKAPGPLTVGDIVDAVGRRQSTVSRHLQLLAETSFVFLEQVGVRTLVRINRSCMADLPAATTLIMAAEDVSP